MALRDLPLHGRLAAFTVLLAVWAGDTFAYFVGRLIGRHKLAPTISPGKTWEGLVGGTAATIFVTFVALYQDRDEFLSIGQALLLGLALAVAAPLGDLFESLLKRDMGVKDSGACSAVTAECWTEWTRSCSRAVAGFYVILAFDKVCEAGRSDRRDGLDRPPGESRSSTRIPASSWWRRPRAPRRSTGCAPLTQVGGDLTELLDRAEPDVVLNAVVGFAGLPVTIWALERGVDLALANKESLVAAGDLALAARERGGGRLLPVDSEHSASFQLLDGSARESVDSIVLTASGGPFRGKNRDELRDVSPRMHWHTPPGAWGRRSRSTARPSRTRASRSSRRTFCSTCRTTGSRWPCIRPRSCMRSSVSATGPRSRTSATPTCASRSRMRSPIRTAPRRPWRRSTLRRAHTRIPRARSGDVSDADARTRGGRTRRDVPVRYNAANEVAVAAFLEGRLPFLDIAEAVEDTLSAVDGAPARDLDELVEADREARRLTELKAASL